MPRDICPHCRSLLQGCLKCNFQGTIEVSDPEPPAPAPPLATRPRSHRVLVMFPDRQSLETIFQELLGEPIRISGIEDFSRGSQTPLVRLEIEVLSAGPAAPPPV